jgi:hypothetical protein
MPAKNPENIATPKKQPINNQRISIFVILVSF